MCRIRKYVLKFCVVEHPGSDRKFIGRQVRVYRMFFRIGSHALVDVESNFYLKIGVMPFRMMPNTFITARN